MEEPPDDDPFHDDDLYLPSQQSSYTDSQEDRVLSQEEVKRKSKVPCVQIGILMCWLCLQADK